MGHHRLDYAAVAAAGDSLVAGAGDQRPGDQLDPVGRLGNRPLVGDRRPVAGAGNLVAGDNKAAAGVDKPVVAGAGIPPALVPGSLALVLGRPIVAVVVVRT